MPKRYAKRKVVTRDVTEADVNAILATLTPKFDVKTQRAKAVKRQKAQVAAAKTQRTHDRRAAKKKASPATKNAYAPVEGADAKGGKTTKGGTKGANLRPETRKTLDSTIRTKAEFEKLSGKKMPENEGLFTKIIHNLSRFNYGSANAVEEAAKELQQSRYEGQGLFGSLADAAQVTDDGWRDGVSLKKKTTFAKVIQNNADRAAAKKRGAAPKDAIANEGKVNPVLKYGAGFVADVGLDPTTYMGLGLVKTAVGAGGKAIKSSEVVDLVENTVKARQKIASTGVKTPATNNKALSAQTIPVERLNKADKARLAANPETKAILDDALAFRKAVGARGVSRARRTGAQATHLNQKVAGGTATLRESFEQLSNDAVNTAQATAKTEAVQKATARFGGKPKSLDDFMEEARQKAGQTGAPVDVKAIKAEAKAAKRAQDARFGAILAEESAKASAKLPFQSADEVTELLLETTAKNLSPEAHKAFALRIGGMKIADPIGLATALTKASQRVGEVSTVKKSVEQFHKTLNANYKISNAIKIFRNQKMGMGGNAVRAEAEELKSVWDGVSRADRIRITRAIRNNSTAGVVVRGGRSLRAGGAVVDNLADHTLKEIREIQKAVNRLELEPNQLNAMLTDKFALTRDELKMITKKTITHADGTKTTKIEDAGWNENWLESKFIADKRFHDVDPADFVYRYRAALQNAIAHDAMNKTIAATHGIPLRKGQAAGSTGTASLANRSAQQLAAKGWKAPTTADGKVVPGMEGHIFHPEIADSIGRLNDVFFSAESRKEYFRTMDKITQGFKAAVTKYVPSFHIRTLMSEVMLGQIGGMKNVPGSYMKALKVLQGSHKEFMGMGAPASTAGYTKTQVNAMNTLNVGGAYTGAGRLGSHLPNAAANNGSRVIMRHPRFGALNVDQLRAYYNTSGLKAGFATTDMQRTADVNPLGKAGRTVSDTGSAVMESVEDLGRMAHFIDILQYSKARTLDEAVDEATEIVLKTHLDYTAVTGREKNVMTRVMPFYKWLRLSTPLMIEHLLTQPGKVMVVPKGMQMVSGLTGYDATERTIAPGNPDEVIPEWLREAGAMPMFEGLFGDNTNYFDPSGTFPLSSVTEAGNAGTTAVGLLHPAFKIAGDVMHDKNKFGPAPSNEAGGVTGLPYAATLTPQTNLVRKLASKPDPNNPEDTRTGDPDISRAQILFDYLANPGLRPNTQNRMASQAKLDQQETSKKLKELKKKLGIVDK